MRDLALDPKSTHFAEHLRRALGVRSDFYVFQVPMWDAETNSRVLRDFPMHLPHECWAEEFDRSPADFKIPGDRSTLPPAWSAHPVTAVNGEDATVPIGLYSDGVPHSKLSGDTAAPPHVIKPGEGPNHMQL